MHTTRLLLTVGADVMCSYFAAGGGPYIVSVARAELSVLCEKIAATHECIELFLNPDTRELGAVLSTASMNLSISCVASPPRQIDAPFPLEAVSPQVQPVDPDLAAPHDCVWVADFDQLLSPVLASLPTGVMDQVTFKCWPRPDAADSSILQSLVRIGNPSASPSVTDFSPTAFVCHRILGTFLHVSYLCAPFSAVRTLATRQHTVQFFMDNYRPLVVCGIPGVVDPTSLLGNTYFRLEAPRLDT